MMNPTADHMSQQDATVQDIRSSISEAIHFPKRKDARFEGDKGKFPQYPTAKGVRFKRDKG